MSEAPESQACLYVLFRVERERQDELLRDFVTPVVTRLRNRPELDSLFFVRFNVPEWQLRFRVLGRPRWIDGPVKGFVEESLAGLEGRNVVKSHEFAEYDREYQRYGGVQGMALAERIFLHDTLACVDLLRAEDEGLLQRTRREYNLMATEKLLDLMRFDHRQRLAFHEFAYAWTIESETWGEEELKILDRRYRSLEPGLEKLLDAEQSDPWGGPAASRIAHTYLDAVRPVVDELLQRHAAGGIEQQLVHLAWSYTHMSCNRLGIDPAPEAILRYFMRRFLEARGDP